MAVAVIGTAHSKFEKSSKSLYELLVDTGREALNDSEVPADQIGGIFIGNYSGGGFNQQEHLAPYAVNIHPDLRFKPSTRYENACASGSAALDAAKSAVESGSIDYALVVGVEKMTTLDTRSITDVLSRASYWPTEGAEGVTFPGLFAKFAKGYQERHSISDEDLRKSLAKISSKNHRNALDNPYAQLPLDCSDQDVLLKTDKENPMIAEPLRLMDCSLVSDGAAAMVLTSEEIAKDSSKQFASLTQMVHTSDYLEIEKRSSSEFTAAKSAVKIALDRENLSIWDIDFAEVHDCFTIAELLSYEALGLAEDGQGSRLLEDGTVFADGKFPVNPSGGLKAKGHPVGATGISMGVLATRQLLGSPVGQEVKNAKRAITLNLGGSAASNYVSIYEKKTY